MGSDFFCLFELTSNRTNNYAESFHSTLQGHFEKKSLPTIAEWMFITREMNATMVFQGELIRSGNQAPPAQSTHSAEMDQKFAKAKVRFQERWDSDAEVLRPLKRFARLAGMSTTELVAEMDQDNIADETNEEESHTYL